MLGVKSSHEPRIVLFRDTLVVLADGGAAVRAAVQGGFFAHLPALLADESKPAHRVAGLA
jgi:hypothetical protein